MEGQLRLADYSWEPATQVRPDLDAGNVAAVVGLLRRQEVREKRPKVCPDSSPPESEVNLDINMNYFR